jgi:hypothetical protein
MPADTPDVASLIADPAYASNFNAVGALANSADDSTLRSATSTLQASLEATANHGVVDQTALHDAMATLTRRCLELGFPVRPVASH